MKSIHTIKLAFALCICIIAGSCGGDSKKAADQEGAKVESTAGTAKYTCPMHPEVMSDQAGTCPQCGMDLVLAEAQGDGHMHEDSTMHH